MIPTEHDDPINAQILAVSEDRIEGFVRDPFIEIATRSGVPFDEVCARLKAMLEIWLYVHVPATFALIAALIAHIVSVFFYW